MHPLGIQLVHIILKYVETAHPSFLRKQESIWIAVNASLPDGFLLPKGTGMTDEQLQCVDLEQLTYEEDQPGMGMDETPVPDEARSPPLRRRHSFSSSTTHNTSELAAIVIASWPAVSGIVLNKSWVNGK